MRQLLCCSGPPGPSALRVGRPARVAQCARPLQRGQLVTARAVAGHGVESAARRTELIRTHASSTSLNFTSDDLFRSDDGDQVLRVLLGTNGNSAVGAPSGTGAGLMVALSGLSFPPGMPERLVNVWLPPDYGSCSRHPVVYAHDGQNLMNPSTAFTGVDWGLGASASGLIAQSAIRSPLIVMVDNAGMLRYAEYGDTPMGAAYRDWVVDTLKVQPGSGMHETACQRGISTESTASSSLSGGGM